jgi:UDP-2-acetamido-2,6-beta-L-arabino-hexul-4-ose reductase
LSIQPEYQITVGELAEQIKSFYDSRNSLISERVGSGLIGKLYSTYTDYVNNVVWKKIENG